MLAINRTDLPIALEGEGVEVRATEAGELTAGWFRLAKGVRLWDLTPLNILRADPLRAACARATGPLNPTVWGFFAPGVAYYDPCAAVPR